MSLENISGFVCTICNRKYPQTFTGLTCPHCGEKGILDVTYDYESIGKQISRESLKADDNQSIWRYLAYLPVRETDTIATLKVGMTPLYKAVNLGRLLETENLYIKDEGLNPTQSLKDRASIIAVVKAKETNAQTIACSSTGNAASSLAGNAAKAGLSCVIFVPKRAPAGKLAQLLAYGANVIRVDGDYKAAFDLSKAAIEKYSWYNRNAAINPFLVEGKKTVAYEICEQLDFQVPDWIVVSVGDGCTIGGVYKGLCDFSSTGMIDRIPKLLGVQSEGCDPIAKAFWKNGPIEPEEENTIADSIAVGIPRNPVKAMRAVQKTGGAFIAVSDKEIMDAMQLQGKTEGVFSEPAASAATAGLIKALKTGVIQKTEKIVVISTGNGLKDTKHALEALPEPVLLKPDIEAFAKYMKNKKEIS
ncbi:MAG TPA: threonine synthase [Bacillota bacterium]|nr:threonine synthase [Bacillota bacterium]